jgi:hypothetical protein
MNLLKKAAAALTFFAPQRHINKGRARGARERGSFFIAKAQVSPVILHLAAKNDPVAGIIQFFKALRRES